MSKNYIRNSNALFRNAVLFSLFPIAVVFIYFIRKLNFDQTFDNQWGVADWLINYQDGGFKRRGLSGSLAFLFQDLSGISLSMIVFLTQLTFFILFMKYYLMGIWRSKLNLLYISLILTPITFLAYPNFAFGFVGRKEIILLFIFSYYIYHLKYTPENTKRNYFTYLMLVFAVFMHELTVFYIPYFIYAGYVKSGKFDIKKTIGFLSSVIVPVLILFLFGGKVNQGESYQIIAQRGLVIDPDGVFDIADNFNTFKHYMEFWPGYSLYLIVIAAGLFHFVYFLKNYYPDKVSGFVRFFMMALLFSLPLFLVAVDWGRWVHIHFMLLLLLLTLFLEPANEADSLPQVYKINTRTNFIATIIICSSFCWKMDHFKIGINPGGIVKKVITSIV